MTDAGAAQPGPCEPPPLLPEDALDRAEAALLDGGQSELALDDAGCRTYRVAGRDGGTVRLELHGARGRPTYARELGAAVTLDFFDADGDGVFERELFEERDDAGWVRRGQLVRGDAGLRRYREERAGPYTRRVVREVWGDGGWVIESDAVEPRKPRLPW